MTYEEDFELATKSPVFFERVQMAVRSEAKSQQATTATLPTPSKQEVR